ncbi:MAG: orotate phosphoribosyltransferase [Anaerolineae bacterium]|nr:orotate phosphoribosyltransferase [Anaerolineae bacterium]
MQPDLMTLLSAREGHFRYESGYHGGLWMDLDPLYLQPAALAPLITRLGHQCAEHRPEMICGPLTGGAFIALSVAAELGVEFCFTERRVNPAQAGLYPVEYPLPAAMRRFVAGKRVIILDDVISAGSAVRGTLLEMRAAGPSIVAVGALLVLGSTGANFFREQGIPVLALDQRDNPMWTPDTCPLCAAGVPLEDHTPEGGA